MLATTHLLTRDDFALVQHDLPARALGAPLHTHANEDEVSHVLAGRLGVQLGDEVFEAGPGETVVKPRGVAHAFWNAGDQPVRFLELITPGAFAGYFAELEPLLAAPGEPDLPALGALAGRYGLELDAASIPRLMAAHRLAG